jgi:hypothetical protein
VPDDDGDLRFGLWERDDLLVVLDTVWRMRAPDARAIAPRFGCPSRLSYEDGWQESVDEKLDALVALEKWPHALLKLPAIIG